MGIGTHYFLEMAKFRAARVFWDEISNSKIAVHATSGTWSQTAYDMYVNLLRGTTQAMSAALAGVDSLEVLPFDGVVAGEANRVTAWPGTSRSFSGKKHVLTRLPTRLPDLIILKT